MFIARVDFGKVKKSKENPEELYDLGYGYLCHLLKNGQVYRGFLLGWTKGKLTGHVAMPRPNSFLTKFNCGYSRETLKQLKKAFGQSPQWHLESDPPFERFASWKSASFLYLSTSALDDGPPVCHGDNGSGIPAYLLPLTDIEKERVYFWAGEYHHLDNVWLSSGSLELPAYKEMADLKSELSKEGREICSIIESKIGVPTYYYLTRYWGRAKGEESRVCPECGGKWAHLRSGVEEGPFHKFSFSCKSCRLASHVGVSIESPARARIGEFHLPKHKTKK